MKKKIEEKGMWNKGTCSNLSHQLAGLYQYTCKKCWEKEKKRKKPLKNGNWCNCKCHHDTYTCIKCFKPVKLIDGRYYYV